MTRTTRVAALTFALAPVTMLAVALAVTLAIAAGAPEWLRLAFRPLCHGFAERCFIVAGTAMPICARCTGAYGGMILGIASFLALPLLRARRFPTMLLALLIAPLAIDGLTQAMGLRVSTNELRVATGILAGWAGLIWALSRFEHYPSRVRAASDL